MPQHALASLNVLAGFEAAARLGSFKEAADELNVTASAISHQVKSLEEQLGVVLFERHPRHLLVTEAGRRYAEEIRPHLLALDEATLRVRKSGTRTQLRITVMPPLATRVLLPALTRFRARQPDFDLRIDTSLRDLDLVKREADLALRSGVPPWPGCTHEKLLDLYAVPVCVAEIARQHDLVQHPENLVRAPIVHSMARPNSWAQYFAHLGMGSPMPVDEVYVDHYPAAIYAAESVGVALALWPLEKSLVDSGRVVKAGPVVGPLAEAIYAVRASERSEDPAVDAFLGWLKEELAALT